MKYLFCTMCLVLLFGTKVVAATDDFQIVNPVTLRDRPWDAQEHIAPYNGPLRNNQPTEAIRWQADKDSALDMPPVTANWQDVESIRFWFHTDKAYPSGIMVILFSALNGYFYAPLPLNFTGWKEITLPMNAFKPNSHDDRLNVSTVTHIAFRAQGYNLPPLQPGTTFWIDDIALKPKPRETITPFTRESNLQGWLKLGEQGNPLLFLNAEAYRIPLKTYRPPQEVKSAWGYYTEAQVTVPIAFAAADPSSSYLGRADLLQGTIDRLDWVAAQFGSDGSFRKGTGEAFFDSNINRFALAALLDCALYLQSFPKSQWPQGVTWTRKEQTLAQLKLAIQHQRDVYDGKLPNNDNQLAVKYYANQDLYGLLIFTQEKLLGFSNADEPRMKMLMQRVIDRLYPDGGIAYIGMDNEAPTYHELDIVLLARYITLTKDPAAIRLLQQTVHYWPLTMTEEDGIPIYYSAPWMKQYWTSTGLGPASLIIISGLTNDARNLKLMADILSARLPQLDQQHYAIHNVYAMPYWTPQLTQALRQARQTHSLPEHFLMEDRNMRGIAGREGTWYYGMTQGRGLRNTFVGGVITRALTDSLFISPIQAAFRGARIKVTVADQKGHTSILWLSEKNDNTCLTMLSSATKSTAILGVRYTLQPNRWPNVDYVHTSPTPWQVTQVWRAAAEGMLGLVTLEAEQEILDVQSITGEIALGPKEVLVRDVDSWTSGPLLVKLFGHFGTVAIKSPMTHNDDNSNHLSGSAWPGIEMNQPVNGTVHKGQQFTYSVWIGPKTMIPPDTLLVNTKTQSTGFTARWKNGSEDKAVFDTSSGRCH